MNSMAIEHGPAKAGHYGDNGQAEGGHGAVQNGPADVEQCRDADREGRGDEIRWRLVNARERTADGAFVYAVTSTGIYCRPSCPSRRPRRDRVVFFDAAEAARAAGFRACKRCNPDSVVAAADPWVEKIRPACVYLSNVDGHPAL